MGATSPIRHLARLSLLVATLLQFAGAVAGPWAHDYGRVPSTGTALCAPGGHDRHSPVTHDELTCWLWQSYGAVAPPAQDRPVPPGHGPEALVAPAPERVPSSLSLVRTRARAPPVPRKAVSAATHYA